MPGGLWGSPLPLPLVALCNAVLHYVYSYSVHEHTPLCPVGITCVGHHNSSYSVSGDTEELRDIIMGGSRGTTPRGVPDLPTL